MLRKVVPLTYSFHRRLLHALGPLLTFFPATLDYSIMLKAGRSCLFSLLYLCTCRYHAVTKYMAVSHRSLCKPLAHALERGEPTDDCFGVFSRRSHISKPPFRSLQPKLLQLSSNLSFGRQRRLLFGRSKLRLHLS